MKSLKFLKELYEPFKEEMQDIKNLSVFLAGAGVGIEEGYPEMLLITHDDLDGAGCSYILGNPKNRVHLSLNDETARNILDRITTTKLQFILVADISFQFHNKICDALEKVISNTNKVVFWVDHHDDEPFSSSRVICWKTNQRACSAYQIYLALMLNVPNTLNMISVTRENGTYAKYHIGLRHLMESIISGYDTFSNITHDSVDMNDIYNMYDKKFGPAVATEKMSDQFSYYVKWRSIMTWPKSKESSDLDIAEQLRVNRALRMEFISMMGKAQETLVLDGKTYLIRNIGEVPKEYGKLLSVPANMFLKDLETEHPTVIVWRTGETWSFRSYKNDAALTIARHCGGGGHKEAAGATFKGLGIFGGLE